MFLASSLNVHQSLFHLLWDFCMLNKALEIPYHCHYGLQKVLRRILKPGSRFCGVARTTDYRVHLGYHLSVTGRNLLWPLHVLGCLHSRIFWVHTVPYSFSFFFSLVLHLEVGDVAVDLTLHPSCLCVQIHSSSGTGPSLVLDCGRLTMSVPSCVCTSMTLSSTKPQDHLGDEFICG